MRRSPSRPARGSWSRRCGRPCTPSAGRSRGCRAPRRPCAAPRRSRRGRRPRRPRRGRRLAPPRPGTPRAPDRGSPRDRTRRAAAAASAVAAGPLGTWLRWPDAHLRAHDALQRHAGPHRADVARAQSVACFVMFAAGSRYERREESGIAHFAEHMFFKGTERRPTARDIATEIDGDRRRVQRLHGQGADRLLRQVRGRDARRRARRARRHAAQLALRRGRDRAREGRHRRGDEHVRRHAAQLRRQRLRAARSTATSRSAGTSSAPRRRSARRRATRSSTTSTAGTGPSGTVVGLGGSIGDDLLERLEELLGDVDAAADRRTRRRRPPSTSGSPGADPHQAVRPGARRARRPRYPHRPSRPLRAAAPLDRARRRHVVAPLHRGARAARPRLLRLLAATARYADAGALAAQAGVDLNRIDDADRDDRRRAAPDRRPSRCRPRSSRRRARSRRAASCSASRARTRRSCSGSAASCSKGRAVEPAGGPRRARRGHGRGRPARRGRPPRRRPRLALIGPFDDPARFERLCSPNSGPVRCLTEVRHLSPQRSAPTEDL